MDKKDLKFVRGVFCFIFVVIGWMLGVITENLKHRQQSNSEGCNEISVTIGSITPKENDTTVWITVDEKRIDSGYKKINFTVKNKSAKHAVQHTH